MTEKRHHQGWVWRQAGGRGGPWDRVWANLNVKYGKLSLFTSSEVCGLRLITFWVQGLPGQSVMGFTER